MREIVELSHVVIATPIADGTSWRVVDVIKGPRPAGGVVRNVALRGADAPRSAKPLLLVRDDAWPMWANLGAVEVASAVPLRVVARKRPADTDIEGWRTRIEALLPHMQGADPLLADVAYEECAAAPYAALRASRSRLKASAIRQWLADPRLAQRRPLHILLLGIAGNGSDATHLGLVLSHAAIARDAKNLGSMLAADLELRGPSRVEWIETTYLRDMSRSRAEIDAALLALSVHGNARGAIPRQRIVEAYRVFMGEHKEIAGLVARDLASWRSWDAVPFYSALIASNARLQYDSRAAIVAYLRESPTRIAGVDDK